MSLADLPPELLLRVSTFLTTTELGHFRLANKPVESVLFESFAREFFTKKQFMLEQISLQALIDISNHPTLSSRLSEVVISTHVLPSDQDMATGFGEAMYKAGYVNHDVLMASGQAINMLVDAFSNLPNLRTVGLRDYDGRGRYRDGEFATWKSWGWSFGWEHEDTLPSGSHQRYLNVRHPEPILPVLLYALGLAKVKPESVHVFLRKPAKLTPRSFNVLDGYMAGKVKPVLSDMKELMLTVGVDSPFNPSFRSGLSPSSQKVTGIPLARMLQHMPKIQTLRLNFDTQQSLGSQFLDWLGSPAPTTQSLCPGPAINPVSLPNLTALELGMLNVPAAVLLKVLTKFNLESFSLWKCILHSASIDNQDNCLQSLLHELAVALPQSTRLKSVLIGYASQMYCGGSGFDFSPEDPIFFKPVGAGEEGTELESQVKHRAGPGTSMKDWLEELSKRTHIKSPDEYSDISTSPETSQSDDDNDQSDDDDDEEDR